MMRTPGADEDILTRLKPAFQQAVQRQDIDWIKRHVIRRSDLNWPTRQQLANMEVTPLMPAVSYAAQQGNEELTELLINDMGAGFEHPTNSPLGLAVQYNRLSLARTLRNYGAPGDCRVMGMPALHLTAARHDVLMAEILLDEPYPAAINATYNQPHSTALYTALYYYNQMLARGQEFKSITYRQETGDDDHRPQPRNEHDEVYRYFNLLITHGADPRIGQDGGPSALGLARNIATRENTVLVRHDPFLLQLFERWDEPDIAVRSEAAELIMRVRQAPPGSTPT